MQKKSKKTQCGIQEINGSLDDVKKLRMHLPFFPKRWVAGFQKQDRFQNKKKSKETSIKMVIYFAIMTTKS